MSHIFISYARGDGDFATVVKARLEDAHLRVWLDTRAIAAGSDWGDEIDRGLDEAIAVVLIMSPEAKASEYVAFEWAYALGANVRVIPILHRTTELHPRLARIQHLDFTRQEARPWDALLELLREADADSAHRARKLPRDAPASVRQAFSALDSPEYKPRRQAISALSRSSHATAELALEFALDHASLDVRAQAASTLAERRNPRCIPVLLALLEDDDWGDDAVKDLARIGEAAVDPLLAVLQDPAQGILRRHLSAVALARSEIPRALAAARGWCRATFVHDEAPAYLRAASTGVSIYGEDHYRGFVRDAVVAIEREAAAALIPPELQALELAETVHHWPHADKTAQAFGLHAVAVPLWIQHPHSADIRLSIAFAKTPALSDGEVTALLAPRSARSRPKRAKRASSARRATRK